RKIKHKPETELGKWKENSNHKLGIYLRSVNDYHLKCARLPPKNQLLEKAQPLERRRRWRRRRRRWRRRRRRRRCP
ncbi:hypothetical protein KR009_011797, partial [Drosophila setifemur]